MSKRTLLFFADLLLKTVCSWQTLFSRPLQCFLHLTGCISWALFLQICLIPFQCILQTKLRCSLGSTYEVLPGWHWTFFFYKSLPLQTFWMDWKSVGRIKSTKNYQYLRMNVSEWCAKVVFGPLIASESSFLEVICRLGASGPTIIWKDCIVGHPAEVPTYTFFQVLWRHIANLTSWWPGGGPCSEDHHGKEDRELMFVLEGSRIDLFETVSASISDKNLWFLWSFSWDVLTESSLPILQQSSPKFSE